LYNDFCLIRALCKGEGVKRYMKITCKSRALSFGEDSGEAIFKDDLGEAFYTM